MEHFPEARASKPGGVPAVRRALMILDLLASSRRGLNLSDISRKLGLPKSSTSRLLQTLTQEQCVHRSTQTDRFYFGRHLFGLYSTAIQDMELCEKAKPFLASLMKRTGMTVHMAVLERNQAVLIEKLEPLGNPPIGTWVGRAMDVHSTAVGKALIAFLSTGDLLREITADTFVRHNRNTITTFSQLRTDLAEVRKQGYSMDNEEDEIGSRCVGAPVFNADGLVTAAISVVGTIANFPEESPALGEIVKETAAAVSARLESHTSYSNILGRPR